MSRVSQQDDSRAETRTQGPDSLARLASPCFSHSLQIRTSSGRVKMSYWATSPSTQAQHRESPSARPVYRNTQRPPHHSTLELNRLEPQSRLGQVNQTSHPLEEPGHVDGMHRNAGWEARAGLTCWGMKELENVTTDQKKIPQLRITFLLKRSPR